MQQKTKYKKKRKKGVYETYTKNLNFIRTFKCSNNCDYCYNTLFKKWKPENYITGYYPDVIFNRSKLNKETFFICTSCDICDKTIPDKWIVDGFNLIKKCFNLKTNTFCTLTKLPERYLSLLDMGLFPKNFLLGVTIESNLDAYTSKHTSAPNPYDRKDSIIQVRNKHENIYVMIEPIIQFSKDFHNFLIDIDAKYYLFGARNPKRNDYEDPPYYKIKALIDALESKGKIVIIKENMLRLGFKQKIGFLRKDITKFKYRDTTKIKYKDLTKF